MEINQNQLELLKRIEEAGNIIRFCIQTLNIKDIKEYKMFREWTSLKKFEKINSIIPKVEHIRDFFNLAYVHYRRYKKKRQARWKLEEPKYHLQIIKSIADKCIVNDELTLDDMKEICMRAYFAFHTALIKAANGDRKKIFEINQRQSFKIAA